MQFIGAWLVTTFIVFLVRYFPTPTVVDFDFLLKTFGWGLLWTVIVNIAIVIGVFVLGYFASKN